MVCKNKTLCTLCNKQISNNNIQKHINSHKNSHLYPTASTFIGPKKGQFGRKAWNKNLTKNTDERVLRYSLSLSKTFKEQVQNGTYIKKSMSLEARKKLSEKQSLNNSGGRSKWFLINGQLVQGTYELYFAKSLIKQNIKWEKIKTNSFIFHYHVNGILKSYTPDFYLPEFDVYVEIKGFWWGNDEQKMFQVKQEHFDKKLIVIFGLNKLEQICLNIKENIPLEPYWTW